MTLKEGKKRKHNYVFGFMGEGNCIHGECCHPDSLLPLTLHQAKKGIKHFNSSMDMAIYKLTLVKIIKGWV